MVDLLQVVTVNVRGHWDTWQRCLPRVMGSSTASLCFCSETHYKGNAPVRRGSCNTIISNNSAPPCDGGAGTSFLISSPLHSFLADCCAPVVDHVAGRLSTLELPLPNGKRLVIIGCYAPATRQLRAPFWEQLCALLVKLTDCSILITGDLNSHLDDDTATDDRLLELMETCHLVDIYRSRHPVLDKDMDATYFGSSAVSRLDYFLGSDDLCDAVVFCTASNQLFDYGETVTTDHRPLVISLDFRCFQPQLQHDLRTIRLPRPVRLGHGVELLQQYSRSACAALTQALPTCTTVHDAAETFTAVLLQTARSLFPPPATAASENKLSPPRSELVRAAWQCRKLLGAVQRGAALSYRQQHSLQRNVLILNRALQLDLSLAADQLSVTFQTVLEVEIAARRELRQSYAVWRRSDDNCHRVRLAVLFATDKERFLRSVKQEFSRPMPRTLLRDGQLLTDAAAILNHAAEHYSHFLGTQGDVHVQPTLVPLQCSPLSDVMTPITRAEVDTALSALQDNAPGIDGATAPLYKRLADAGRDSLVSLFNWVLESMTWPRCWKQSVITPVPKTGDQRDLNNTRPISVSPILARLFEGILSNRVQNAVGPLLHTAQAAFLRHRNTTEHGLVLRMCLEYARDARTPVFGVLLDIAKAYDTVSWLGLWASLDRVNLPANFVSLVKSMHIGSTSVVNTAFGLSAPFVQRRGLLQGNPLSCLLFDIFMDPILCALTKSGYGYRMHCDALDGCDESSEVIVSALGYADDLCVLSESHVGAEQQVQFCTEYLAGMGMEINPKKSVFFTTSADLSPLRCGRTFLPCANNSDSWRYLGFQLNPTLSRAAQERALLRYAKSMRFLIRQQRLPPEQVAYIIRTVIYSACLYKASLGLVTTHCLLGVQRQCNELMRECAHLPPWTCCEALQLPQTYGGLSIGSLQVAADTATVEQALSLLSDDHSLPGRLFRLRLSMWQRLLHCSASPLQDINKLLGCHVGANTSVRASRVDCYYRSVAAAAHRLRIDSILPAFHCGPATTACRSPARDNNLTLREAFHRYGYEESWVKHQKEYATAGLLQLSDIFDASGTRLRPLNLPGISGLLLNSLVAENQWLIGSAAPPLPGVWSQFSVLPISSALLSHNIVICAYVASQRERAAVCIANRNQALASDATTLFVSGALDLVKTSLLGINYAVYHAPPSGNVQILSSCRAAVLVLQSVLQHDFATKHIIHTIPWRDLIMDTVIEIRRRRLASQCVSVSAQLPDESEWSTTVAACTTYIKRQVSLSSVPITAATSPIRVPTPVLLISGMRLERTLKMYAERLFWMSSLIKRNDHSNQGAGFRALTSTGAVHPVAAEPTCMLESKLKRFPIAASATQPKPNQRSLCSVAPGWDHGGRELFLAMYNLTPTAALLHRYNLRDDPGCSVCGEVQSMQHLLTTCPRTRFVRAAVKLRFKAVLHDSVVNNMPAIYCSVLQAWQSTPTPLLLFPPAVLSECSRCDRFERFVGTLRRLNTVLWLFLSFCKRHVLPVFQRRMVASVQAPISAS